MDQTKEQLQISEYEKLRERLLPIVFTLKQLELKQAVVNPRVVVHGSTVNGTKSPSDTDIFVIFDRLSAKPQDISDDERKMYEAMKTKRSEGGEILTLDGIDAYPEETDEFITAIRQTKETQVADLLTNLGAFANKMNLEIPGEEMVKIAGYLPDLILAAEPQRQKPFYEQITRDQFDQKRTTNLIIAAIINVKKILLEQEVGTGIFEEMYRKIEDQFSNDGAIKDSNHAKAAITQLVNFVGNKIELIYASLGHSEVGTKRAAQLRGFYQMYNLGLNFIQSCVVNGGVIIYGPNIEADPETQRLLGLKGKYLFEEDRDLIKISTPQPA